MKISYTCELVIIFFAPSLDFAAVAQEVNAIVLQNMMPQERQQATHAYIPHAAASAWRISTSKASRNGAERSLKRCVTVVNRHVFLLEGGGADAQAKQVLALRAKLRHAAHAGAQ
jgi:hypothetical protein